VYSSAGKLKASSDPKEVFIASRLKAGITAEYFDKYIPLYAIGDLLDLGCGKVPLYLAYKDFVRSVTCVDWNENPFLDLKQDLSEPLPFESDSFDTIILSDVLEHIPEPGSILSELYRVLRVNGVVIINVPFFYWLHEKPHDYYRFTEFALRRYSKSLHFEIIALESSGGAVEILCDIIAKNLVFHVKYIGKPIAGVIQSLNLLFLKTRVGKKIRKITSRNFPIDYFLILQK
jgi:SAM-dependent methyltransferase